MENKQIPSKKLVSIKEEKLLRKVDYDTFIKKSLSPKKTPPLYLEITPTNKTRRHTSQKVLVSIKPCTPPIKTIYIAEKNRFNCKKGAKKSGSHLGIGDHSSVTASFSEDDSNSKEVNFVYVSRPGDNIKSEIALTNESSISDQVESSTTISKCSHVEVSPKTLYNVRKRSAEKCYIYTQPQIIMNLPHTSTESSIVPSTSTLNKLNKRIDHLERKLMKQEMVFRSMNPNLPLSSSDEEAKDYIMKASGTTRPGCSYIEQYSHVPETSAFQKYTHQPAPLSPSKATTLEKEHNSEQYGRDFTTYDGITARGRRQCASVPCKRDDIPRVAAERVHKIRHRLNPVRDYRLMDTIHYLAQGEFAPRDDGIKLTPSREAVLSDIIYEDVCRTHWPNARLSRRIPHAERCSTRCELQRLIDNLLRERVAHVERRRRRHYRIVKLNHRHESCRPVGKTGDIIVASHKNKSTSEEKEMASTHNAACADMAEKRREDRNLHKGPHSHDRFMFPEIRRNHRYEPDNSVPGPSYAGSRSPTNREATCCYHTSNHLKKDKNIDEQATGCHRKGKMEYLTSSSSISTNKHKMKNPRLVVKKETSRRKCQSKDGPDLEHYILLPTLVVRTPSNVKRQKKFNELYHRILNVQLNDARNEPGPHESVQQNSNKNIKKDVGFNINITLSDSSQ
ncbi:unnamed protein product [Diatraea saccharalis]|uniref:Uncharacterized protein n=1 Tax=Diatraea saccharalis TaxID=40085 RepID=A0A9N9R018_9NEOP|nr:unnamed protein product [Diatraea saccharalis]